jgi:tRNA 2-thiouridine synthesizing protein A
LTAARDWDYGIGVDRPEGALALKNVVRIDCSGMRCPQPVLKLAVETADTPAGTVVEILGDCPTFEKDIRTFCDRRRKTLLSVRPEGEKTLIQIQY